MSQPESRLSRKIQQEYRTKPQTFCYKNHGSEFMVAGLPDIQCCIGGWFIGLEVKMPGKKHTQTERQKFIEQQIKAAGGEYYLVESVEEALEVWNDVARRAGVVS